MPEFLNDIDLKSSTLTIGVDTNTTSYIKKMAHSDGAGGNFQFEAGHATQGQTNKNGGDFKFGGGRSTGSGEPGDILFYTGANGTTGSDLNGQSGNTFVMHHDGIWKAPAKEYSVSGSNGGDYGIGTEILYGISSDSTTAGVIYILNAGTWVEIDANTEVKVDALCAVAASNRSDLGMIIKGCVTLSDGWTDSTGDAAGVIAYASETPGEATLVAPSDSGDFVRILGYSLGVASKKMWFDPDKTYVEIA